MKQVLRGACVAAPALYLILHAGCSRTSRSDDPAGVRLNEVMAQNVSFPVMDASGNPSNADWVEIQNTLATPISLTGYGLSDRSDDPFRFEFPPGTVIPPGGFLLVFLLDTEECIAECTQEDATCRAEANQPADIVACAAELVECNASCNPRGLVSGFNLNDAGEALFLFSPQATLIDRVGVEGQPPNVSNGIDPVTGEYGVLYKPTPGAPNAQIGRKPLRLQAEPTVINAQADDQPWSIEFTLEADAPAPPPAVFIESQFVMECSQVVGPGASKVPPELVGEKTLIETRSDFNPPETEVVEVIQRSFKATMPVGPCKQTVTWRLTAFDDEDQLVTNGCTKLCQEKPTVLVSEYQPTNPEKAPSFLVIRDGDTEPIAPDWIEIHNYGDKTALVSNVGVLDKEDFDERQFGRWQLGKDADIHTIDPGKSVLVLAIDEPGVVFRSIDGSLQFRSTRFALDPTRKEGDFFALTFSNNPQDPFSKSGGEVLDEVNLVFTKVGYTPGQSVGRTSLVPPVPEKLDPGTIFDCPTPGAENVIECDTGPVFSPGVAVETLGGLRCPDANEPATLHVRVAFDSQTPETNIAAELRFRAAGAAETVLPLVLEKDTGNAYEGTGVIPGQPAGTHVAYSFRAIDTKLGLEAIHSAETDPSSSFQYIVGSRPGGPLRLNEVLPQNLATALPFTDFLPDSQRETYPEYLELHNSSDAPVPLEGYHLTDTLDRARLFRFPAGAVVPPRGFLNVYLGEPVPPSLCTCALPPIECDPGAPACPTGPYIEVDEFLLDVEGKRDAGTVYLVAPDAVEAGANCVVDTLSWSITDDGDIAVGRMCDGAEKVVQLTRPTPESSNVLEPIVHDAYHKVIPSLERNVCVPAGASVQLNVVLFLDSTFRGLMPSNPGLFKATFFVDRGSGEESLGTVDITDLGPCGSDFSKDCATAPAGYAAVALKPRAPVLPPFAAVVRYRAEMTACGTTFMAGPFSFGTDQGEHPRLAINEMNRFSPVAPGGVARPWVEIWNAGTTEVDLGGMFLTDNAGNPRKARLPDGTRLAAGSALLVLTNGTASPPEVAVDLDWPLNNKGSLFLVDSEARGACTVDTFPYDFTPLPRGASLGRIPDGSGPIAALDAPSPGRGNESGASTFIRADANGDLRVNVSDMIRTLAILFGGETARPACEDALDANDDGAVDGTDPVYLGNSIFLQGPPIPLPYPGAGEDPTPDALAPCAGAP